MNDENPNLADYLLYPEIEGCDLAVLPAGNLRDGFDPSVLDFTRLLEVGELLNRLRRDIESLGFTYALIDSRTGLTEIAATCTLGLADVVVMLTGLNNQNLQGTRWILDMLENEGGLRSEDIIVVLSPVPEAEEELKAERFQRAREIVGNRDVLLLPYHPRLALVEELFVKEWNETSLAQKYHQLASTIYRRNPDDTADIQIHKPTLDDEPAFHSNLAHSLIQIGEYEEAEKHCLRALELNESHFTPHDTYGELLLKTGRLEESEKHFIRSLELKEDEPETHERYAQLLRQIGRSEEAEVHERRAKEWNK